MDPDRDPKNPEIEIGLRTPVKNDKDFPKKSKGTMARVNSYFREYCNSTSIHGMKYLAESRSLGERLLWFTLITCSLSACGYLIVQIYSKFERSPVIVSFATAESPIYTIPFPAVTICPLTNARKSLFNFTHIIHKIKRKEHITNEEKRYAKYMALICEEQNKLFLDEPTFTDDMFKALDELKIPMDEIMVECEFMNFFNSCSELFSPIILDQSICYTFNMLDRKHIFNENVVHYQNYHSINKIHTGWTIDRGYERKKKYRDYIDYPLRAFLAGADNALKITLHQNISDNDYLCVQDVQGFSVTVHAPFALPLLKKQFFTVPFTRSIMALVEPKFISTSDKVLQFSPDIRECYFSTEKKLKYFKIYSPRNCKLECLTNFTLKTCGCVSYYMPRENNTSICGNGNYTCMEKAEFLLKIEQLQRQIEEENEDFYCDCKPLCSDLTYDVVISTSPWDFKDQFNARNIANNKKYHERSRFAKLSIFFKQDSFLTSQRNELYGPTDFLANFGGLLGLFTGFSLLSAAEIIYFLSVRLCCNFRLFGTWTGQN